MKNQKGITLIALIITIIVMLILVGVTVAVVINSDLIGTAKKAGEDTLKNYNTEKTNEFAHNIQVNENGTLKNVLVNSYGTN